MGPATIVLTALAAFLIFLGLADACRPLNYNKCKTDSECCSGYCWYGGNWAEGVCKERPGGGGAPPPAGGTGEKAKNITLKQFRDAVTRNGFPAPSKQQFAGFKKGLPRGEVSTKREAAMALAQFIHESGGLRLKKEWECENNEGCWGKYRKASCDVPGKKYFGRGYIQLTWCKNYLKASQDLYGDDRLKQNPELVSDDEQTSWDTTFSYWKHSIHNGQYAKEIVQDGKFGYTTKVINGWVYECQGNGQNADKSRNRFKYYQNVLSAFGSQERANEEGCNY